MLVFSTTALPVITIGAVLTGFGTGLLPPTLLTWAVNRLRFEQRGRGTGLWTGTLFIGQFLSPILLAAIGAGVGGLQPPSACSVWSRRSPPSPHCCWSVATTNGSTSPATKTKIEHNDVPASRPAHDKEVVAMDLPGIDLNLLVALRALLRERNVTRAGQAIGLSQPATSAALARLRRHFGYYADA